MLDNKERILDSGDKETDILESKSSLANWCLELGQYQKATQLFKQILQGHKHIFGDEHPDTLRSMDNLATSYSYLGQYQEAMHLGKQTLELQRRILGEEHPDTLKSMDNLAMHLYQHTLELRKRILGYKHPDTLWSMNDLAESYRNLDENQQVINLYRQMQAAQNIRPNLSFPPSGI